MDYTFEDSPKSLRETLCMAQTGLSMLYRSSSINEDVFTLHSNRLQHMINECDRHRPLGPDGKHGNLHTATCGCEDVIIKEKLEWGAFLGRQCLARLAPNETAFWGRCELKPHDNLIEHALERGMIWVRWQDARIRLEGPHYD